MQGVWMKKMAGAVLAVVVAAAFALGVTPAVTAKGAAREGAEKFATAPVASPERDDAKAADEASGETSVDPQDDDERAAQLERWDALLQKRAELRRQLSEVNRELRELARTLWPDLAARDGKREWESLFSIWPTEEEWEAWRDELQRYGEQMWERFSERMAERLKTHGPEILPWVPEAVIERWAERIGRTPDEVRALIEEGAWDVLLRPRKDAGADGETHGEDGDLRDDMSTQDRDVERGGKEGKERDEKAPSRVS